MKVQNAAAAKVEANEDGGCGAVCGTYVCWLDEGHGGKYHEAFAGQGDKRGTVKILKFVNGFGTEEKWVGRKVLGLGEKVAAR